VSDDLGKPRTFTRGPLPLSERPPKPASVTMISHRDDDGRITHYEFSGDPESLEQQLELLTAALRAMKPVMTLAPVSGLKTHQALAAYCLQLAGLIALQVEGGMRAPYSSLTQARTTLQNTLAYLKARRNAILSDDRSDEAEADHGLTRGYAYFQFDWDALFASIRG
jgi:hypothetical protein